MTVYALIEFLHVLGAMGVFAAAALEWSSLGLMRRANTLEEARAAVRAQVNVDKFGGPSMGVVLLAGGYLAGTTWGMRHAWIAVGLASFVLMGAIGGVVTGRRRAALGKALGAAEELTHALRARLRDPALVSSFRVRLAILAGIVFQMTAKPDWPLALASAGAAIVLGLAASVPAWRSAPSAAADPLFGNPALQRYPHGPAEPGERS